MDAEILARPGHLITRAARLLVRWGERRFQPMGLAIAQVPVFGALKDGGSMTQSELARLALIEQPTMAQLLNRMERDGLIQRSLDPTDRRRSLVSLTLAAKKKMPGARKVLFNGSTVALKGFSEQEVATLTSMLKRIVENLADGTDDIADPMETAQKKSRSKAAKPH